MALSGYLWLRQNFWIHNAVNLLPSSTLHRIHHRQKHGWISRMKATWEKWREHRRDGILIMNLVVIWWWENHSLIAGVFNVLLPIV